MKRSYMTPSLIVLMSFLFFYYEKNKLSNKSQEIQSTKMELKKRKDSMTNELINLQRANDSILNIYRRGGIDGIMDAQGPFSPFGIIRDSILKKIKDGKINSMELNDELNHINKFIEKVCRTEWLRDSLKLRYRLKWSSAFVDKLMLDKGLIVLINDHDLELKKVELHSEILNKKEDSIRYYIKNTFNKEAPWVIDSLLNRFNKIKNAALAKRNTD